MKRKLVSVTEGHPEAKEGLDKGNKGHPAAKEGLDKGGEAVPGVVIRWLRELTASNAAVVWLSLPLSRP